MQAVEWGGGQDPGTGGRSQKEHGELTRTKRPALHSVQPDRRVYLVSHSFYKIILI